MTDFESTTNISRRDMLGAVSMSAAAMAVVPMLQAKIFSAPAAGESAAGPAVNGIAGVDRIVVLPGKTYLRGWAGHGEPPQRGPRRPASDSTPVVPEGPPPKVRWSKRSGPGQVAFADPAALMTTATFSTPGAYVLALTADDGQATASSTLSVKVELPPPATPLEPIAAGRYSFDSPLWNDRAKVLMVSWIPHCLDQLSNPDVQTGGIDNFIEAGKKLRGEPSGPHKGYVFSNAYVHNAVEAMSVALMVDPKGDADTLAAHQRMHATLDEWIPIILAAQEPDGYMQTAFTLPRVSNRGGDQNPGPFNHWERRADHEGYTGGYFIESAIAHYTMTEHKDARLYNAARKLADCWCNNLGPAPKKAWYDGHQEMEQAMVRLGRFVNATEGKQRGQKYIELGKFLLDNRYTAARNDRERSEYDQSHLPVIEQYEAVGHAVRAAYSYSGMADVAMETRDPDYRSAVRSLWDNIVHKKYYVTGGVGSGETSEGFGGNYSLRNNAYCESCSGCGEIFFQWKLGLTYHDATYADLYEETLYNALLGGLALDGKTFYYPNPLDVRTARVAWHSVPCCVGNIPRTLLSMPTWMYARGADGIRVNLFAGSTVMVNDVAGTNVQLVQKTNYPWDGRVAITVKPSTAKRFSMYVRVPNRGVSDLYTSTPAANGITSIRVNGSVVTPTIERGYAVINRTWKSDDRIELELPMKIQRVRAVDAIEADRGKVALRYGPLMYSIENVDVGSVTKVLSPDAPLTTEWRADLLGGVVVIKGAFTDGSPMIAIPNYARMNREPAPPPQAVAATPPAPGAAPAARPQLPVVSVVWINERAT
ncbi:MAG: beta-L-arabinofuranosidase domain-containing protein [bacterium]